jgi:hypothetical protein
MDINGFYRAGKLAAETGPAVLRISYCGPLLFIHDENVARTE